MPLRGASTRISDLRRTGCGPAFTILPRRMPFFTLCIFDPSYCRKGAGCHGRQGKHQNHCFQQKGLPRLFCGGIPGSGDELAGTEVKSPRQARSISKTPGAPLKRAKFSSMGCISAPMIREISSIGNRCVPPPAAAQAGNSAAVRPDEAARLHPDPPLPVFQGLLGEGAGGALQGARSFTTSGRTPPARDMKREADRALKERNAR